MMTGVNTFLGLLKNLTTLQLALGISGLLHAGLLTVRFVDPKSFDRIFQNTPLEVILVNAKSDQVPQQAMAIAQANLTGGGDADQGRTTSPLPSTSETRTGDATEDEQEHIQAFQEKQNQLLAQVRHAMANLPPPDLEASDKNHALTERERKRQALVNKLAEIERRITEENARPRKRYVGPSTREEVYAIYYDELRRKIEDQGTRTFPESAGHKLYGELTMIITVNHTGAVLATEVFESSGNRTLDRHARSIVEKLVFGQFSEDMRRRADQIVVVSRFRFTREAGLKTQMSIP